MSSFTVCIPVYNGADFLDSALASIEKQTLKGVEVVVSNNASTDATSEILDRWSDRLNLRIVNQPQTLPMQDHFNVVLDLVETEFYMLLCHDDYLADPNALVLAQEALKKSPEASAVYCNLLYVNIQGRTLASRYFKRGARFNANETGLKTLRTARNLFGIPIGIRRSSLANLRYDPQFHYTMDVDLSWAISKNSPALHIDEYLIANRYGATNATWSLIASSQKEFFALAKKYNVRMNFLDKLRFMLTNFIITQKKRVFGLYGRIR